MGKSRRLRILRRRPDAGIAPISVDCHSLPTTLRNAYGPFGFGAR